MKMYWAYNCLKSKYITFLKHHWFPQLQHRSSTRRQIYLCTYQDFLIDSSSKRNFIVYCRFIAMYCREKNHTITYMRVIWNVPGNMLANFRNCQSLQRMQLLEVEMCCPLSFLYPRIQIELVSIIFDSTKKWWHCL